MSLVSSQVVSSSLATAMVLVPVMAIAPSKTSLACTVIVLVDVIAMAAETYLMAATAMVDWSKISNWALEIVEPATAMVLVSEIITNAYLELDVAAFDPSTGIISLRDDSDGQGAYVAKWDYSKNQQCLTKKCVWVHVTLKADKA